MGDDLWVSPGGGSYDNEMIPGGFFDPGSDPFVGGINLIGGPIAGGPALTPDPALLNVDTIVRRTQPTPISFQCGGSATVPIEIVALSLVSSNPITVTYGGGSPEQWNVKVCLDGPPLTQPFGSMTLKHECQQGGTYSSTLPVRALLTFTRVAPPQTRTIVHNLTMASNGYWAHVDPGFALSTIGPGTPIDTNCDGVFDIGSIGSSNFFPGLWSGNCTSCLAPPAGFKKPMTPEQALWASHGVFVANEGKPQHVLTIPCNLPPSAGGGCVDVEQPHCLQRGGTPGPGSQCIPLPTLPFKNWVIADDFMVACADCTCDLNRDGVCDTLDDAVMHNCELNPAPPICRNADFDCDGDVDNVDDATWYCLRYCNGHGLPPETCCPNPRPRVEINKLRWYGSYLDPAFDPSLTLPPRKPDGWYVALHSDLPPQLCPPLPAGPGTTPKVPFDLCCTLEGAVENGCLTCRPDGSAFVYGVSAADVFPHVVGEKIRICGYLTTLPTTCMQGSLGHIVVNSVMDCDTKVSRPDKLIAQWYFPDMVPEQTGKVGWDSHSVFCYNVDLRQGCLLHNFAGKDEIPNPNGPFFPRNNRTYWLSIQAEVGASWVKTAAHQCMETKTGQTITQPFWGWHTTPPGYQHKDDAYMGQIAMGCPPDEWLYEWMSPLHCSDSAAYRDCCDDPTKSIDMAFYLLKNRGGLCQGTNIPCQFDTDCPVPGGCVNGGDFAWWCQPVNGGPPSPTDPPTIAGPRSFPVGGIDELTNTQASVVVNLPGQQQDLILQGPTVVARSGRRPPTQVQPQPEPPLPTMIETEMLMLDLRSSDGTILRLNRNAPRSMGQAMAGAGGAVDPYPSDSFFDIFIEIELPPFTPIAGECTSNAQFPCNPTACTNDSQCAPGCRCARILISGNTAGTGPGSVHLDAQIHEVPPGPTTYTFNGGVPLLRKGSLQPVGSIKFVGHQPPYRGGFNIHSDTDWVNIPADQCCAPLQTSATLCTNTVCPNPTEKCRPTGIVWQPPAQPTAVDCLCQEDTKCHLEFNAAGPVCVNPCPDPALVCTRLGTGTAADPYYCNCEPAPACQPNSTGTACTPCPIAGQECVPKKIWCEPGTSNCKIVACECKQQNCHVDLNAAGIPYCPNKCPDPLDTCEPSGADTDGDGVVDLWECICVPPPPDPVCEPNSLKSGCNPITCPAANEKCKKKCVILNPFTGTVTLSECDCVGPNDCHMEMAGAAAGGGNVAGGGGTPPTGDCVAVEDPLNPGTVKLPPDGCPYLSPDEYHKIVDGLPEGVTIEIGAIHKDFMCRTQPGAQNFCSFMPDPAVDCEDENPKDSTDGAMECNESTLELNLRQVGTPETAGPGFMGTKSLMVRMETHTGPRTPGMPMQSFDTDMFRLQGQLAIGDPDFDLLRIKAGTDFGMPSPGHTTLTKLPGGPNWAVDSFFDIFYDIEFIGKPCPGSIFCGRSGSTTGTIRMATKAFKCVGNCPAGSTCAEKRTPLADGTIKVCCDCATPPPVIVWNPDVLSPTRTTRSLRFRVAGAAPTTASGSPGQSALKVTMVDLQTPVPPNLPVFPPPNFSGYECAAGAAPGCTGACAPRTCVGGPKNGATCVLPAPVPTDCPAPGVCTAAVESGGCGRWVGRPGTFLEDQDVPGGASYKAARLQCSPFYWDWVTETMSGPIAVYGGEIAPSSQYSVQAYSVSCKGVEAGCADVSAPVSMLTRRACDVEAVFNPPGGTTQPDAIDVAQVVAKVKNLPGALVKSISQLQPNLPELNANVSALDILSAVDRAKGFAYEFSGPCPCPSTVTCGPAVGSVACATASVCITAFGPGALCVKTCVGGTNAGEPCIRNSHCPGGGTCGNALPNTGFCRDRCGRCSP